MTYYHTVTTFSGSLDPVKVTHYTNAAQEAYVITLPADAVVHYAGTSAGDMRSAFNAARNAPTPTGQDIQDSIAATAALRAIQRVCESDEIHTRAQIQAIVDFAAI